MSANTTIRVSSPSVSVIGGARITANIYAGTSRPAFPFNKLLDADPVATPGNRFFVVGDGAKFVTRGITGNDLPNIPLSKLSNITTAQLSLTAGITSGQIASLNANKIAGFISTTSGGTGVDASASVGFARFSAGSCGFVTGTSAQFIRADGVSTNALTGGLTLEDTILFSQSISGTTPPTTSRWIYPHVSGILFNVPSALGYQFRVGNSTFGTISSSGTVWAGTTHDWNSGAAQIRFSSAGIGLSSGLGTATITMGSGNITMGSGAVNLGSTGTVSPAANEIRGTTAGPRINANSGLSVGLSVAGSVIASASSLGLAVTGALDVTSSGGDGHMTLRPTGVGLSNFITFLTSAGAIQGRFQNVNTVMYYGFDNQVFRLNNGTHIANIADTGVTLSGPCKIIYGNAGTTTAANAETVGTSTGPITNAPSGSTVRTAIAGTTVVSVSNTGQVVTGTGSFSSTVRLTNSSGFIVGAADSLGAVTIGGGGASPAGGGAVSVYGTGYASGGLGGSVLIASRTAPAKVLIQCDGVTQLDCGTGGTTVAKIILVSNAPATATSPGTAGQIAWDASGNIYICSATNTWRRVATSTF